MPDALPLPTVDDVTRIKTRADAVIRNLQITQYYYLLSLAFAPVLGQQANWCTFATWASKQAGQTIRKEDFRRLLERRLRQSAQARQAAHEVAAVLPSRGENQLLGLEDAGRHAERLTPAIERASAAVARGNKKVFEEIAEAFARFYQECFRGGEFDPRLLEGFLNSLRPGDPPDGQALLRQAFTHYAQAIAEGQPKLRDEWILLANLKIGLHEQTRLQPEIAEGIESGWISFFAFARALLGSVFPAGGALALARMYLQRLRGRPGPLERALQDLFAEARAQFRQLITQTMMTITLPSGQVLDLSKDLSAGFPDTLRQISNPALLDFLRQHDRSPDGARGTGALDWADLPDRLNFIIGLFRCYQATPALFDAPFLSEQVEALNNGRLPQGRL